jgi:hypothetical protein
MIIPLILAHASTASLLAPPAGVTAALLHTPAPAAMPSANTDTPPSEAAGGLLHLLVKQRPFEEASSIQVTAKDIKVQKSEAPMGRDWITVIKGEKTFELVGSEQGEEVLGGKTLAEGLYSRVQLDIVSVKVTLKGRRRPAKVVMHRLKEIRPFEIDMATVCILTLDFDVAKSLLVPASGEIHFKPVVRFMVKRGAPG